MIAFDNAAASAVVLSVHTHCNLPNLVLVRWNNPLDRTAWGSPPKLKLRTGWLPKLNPNSRSKNKANRTPVYTEISLKN
jgi:hypothetical protein